MTKEQRQKAVEIVESLGELEKTLASGTLSHEQQADLHTLKDRLMQLLCEVAGDNALFL